MTRWNHRNGTCIPCWPDRLRLTGAHAHRHRPLSGVRRSLQEPSCSIRQAYRLNRMEVHPSRPARAGSGCSVRTRPESASERRRYSEGRGNWEEARTHCMKTCRAAMFTSAHRQLCSLELKAERRDPALTRHLARRRPRSSRTPTTPHVRPARPAPRPRCASLHREAAE